MGTITFLAIIAPWWGYLLLVLSGILCFVHYESSKGLSKAGWIAMLLLLLAGCWTLEAKDTNVLFILFSFFLVFLSGFLILLLADLLFFFYCCRSSNKAAKQWKDECKERDLNCSTGYEPGDFYF